MIKTKFGYVVDPYITPYDPIVYGEFTFQEDHSNRVGWELWSDSDGVCWHPNEIYATFEEAKAVALVSAKKEADRLEEDIADYRSIVLTDPRNGGK